ncbi:sulfite exporter TauE/SafE family protein [Microscilla marina]|uniref:Probable membrane transporter protein n=1 Tax=Microscilla marina ATCC 23134 TaxID=313606 RepID=A1ZTG4_MICM2|nr:sulfite exporter TauE/SafE family protein [Microscilla marina]EAY26386.1 hypothetical conserved protein [Microscilla marina ATCC 23134]
MALFIFDLSSSLQLSWLSWVLAGLAGFIIGVSKAGIKGISIMVVTLMAMVFGGKASTGIILPLLLVGDVFAVIYYHRYTEWHHLKRLLPAMMLGVVVGAWVGKDLPERVFKQMMAAIILATVAMMYWWDRQKNKQVPDHWWFAIMMGLMAGFTTMIGNLAGAFTNLFFLAMRLPKNNFIGTAAWLFLLINLFKLPFHIFAWQTINLDTASLDVRLVPLVLLGLLTGVRLVRKINERYYRKLILILTGIGAIVILLK